VGQEIGGCEAAQTNNNTFLIKPGLPITTYMDFNSSSALTQDISYSYLTACDASLTGTDFTSFVYMSLDSDSSPSL
jgi:hypothetical protein